VGMPLRIGPAAGSETGVLVATFPLIP